MKSHNITIIGLLLLAIGFSLVMFYYELLFTSLKFMIMYVIIILSGGFLCGLGLSKSDE